MSSILARQRVAGWPADGEPPATKIKGSVETLKFVIPDVQNLRCDRESIDSKPIKAQGRDWRIEMLLGSYINPSHISCYLNNLGTDTACVSYTFVCKDRRWKRIHAMKPNAARGCHRFIEWSEIGDFLEPDGSLVIEVEMVWYPPAFQRQSVLVDMYQDASSDTADVVFCVGKDEKEYKAHKSVLAVRLKQLYKIAKECDRKRRFNHPIVISSIRSEVFKTILDFSYTAKLPVPETKCLAIELLVAADRVGCVQLKLLMESFIADKFLTPENAAELLLLADSRSCALLKEAATNMFVWNPEAVRKGEAFHQLFQSDRLITEWLDAHGDSLKSNEKGSIEDNATMNVATLPNKLLDENRKLEYYATMNVATLRNKLQDENLEVDGSREILVQRLKDFDEKGNDLNDTSAAVGTTRDSEATAGAKRDGTAEIAQQKEAPGAKRIKPNSAAEFQAAMDQDRQALDDNARREVTAKQIQQMKNFGPFIEEMVKGIEGVPRESVWLLCRESAKLTSSFISQPQRLYSLLNDLNDRNKLFQRRSAKSESWAKQLDFWSPSPQSKDFADCKLKQKEQQ